MEDSRPNLLTREDTLLGVCQGLAEDLGFNPLWLRLAFTIGLFFQPAGALAGYAAAGLIVLASRLIFPDPRPARAAETTGEQTAPAEQAEAEPDELPLAA